MPRPNLYRDFIVVYGLLTAVRTLPRLKSKADAKQIIQALLLRGQHSETLRDAIFAIALPRIYSFWDRRYPKSAAPAILSSPLFHLIDASSRRTLAVYVATAAAVNLGRGSKQRKMLPPTWTLILIANSWLLWAFLFQPKCFPRAYGDLILRHSGYGSGEPTEDLVFFLQHTRFESYSPGILSSSQSASPSKVHPDHTRAVCARLHPANPSCLDTYIQAWLTQFPHVFKWVGTFGALTLLFKRRELRAKTLEVSRDWLLSSLRGTMFVVGTINTCWGLTCLFQRIFSPGVLPHLRWVANGLLGDLWILILPTRRRSDLALYCTRLAVVSCWNLLNEWSPRCGECIIFALSWSSLLRDRRQGRGPHGLGGLVLDYIENHATTIAQ